MASTYGSAEIGTHTATATRHIRPLRGQTQAQLVETECGHAYVTKLQNNPFGHLVLASEWVGGLLMQHLGLPLPPFALIQTPCWDGFGERSGGLHFGSLHPGEPKKHSVYDFVPDCMLAHPHLQRVFAGACVFDMWTANADRRGAVFHQNGNHSSLEALFIDNSHLFGGLAWNFSATADTATSIWRSVYRSIHDWNSLTPWIGRIEQIATTDLLWRIANSVPEEWLRNSGRNRIEQLVETLRRRSQNLPERIDAHFRARPEVFVNWQARCSLSMAAVERSGRRQAA